MTTSAEPRRLPQEQRDCGCWMPTIFRDDLTSFTVSLLLDVADHSYIHSPELGCCWDGVLARRVMAELCRRMKAIEAVINGGS